MGGDLFCACKCKEEDLKQSSINSITTSIVVNKKDTNLSLDKKTDDKKTDDIIKEDNNSMKGMEYYNVFQQRIISSSEINQNLEKSLVLESIYQ